MWEKIEKGMWMATGVDKKSFNAIKIKMMCYLEHVQMANAVSSISSNQQDKLTVIHETTFRLVHCRPWGKETLK